MKKQFLFAFCWGLYFFALPRAQAEIISDRLVLEINKSAYTQRQLELYAALRSALVSSDPTLVGQKNWHEQLELFRREMIVEQEAQRLSSTQPNRKTVQAGLDILEDRRKKSAAFATFLKRMQADEPTQRRILASIIRVRAFLASKEKQYAPDSSRLQEKADVDFTADWFVKLEQRTPYRVFEGARQYMAIDPNHGFQNEKKL